MTDKELIERERLERVRLQGISYTNEELIQFLAAGMIRQRRLEEDLTARDKEIRELKQRRLKVIYGSLGKEEEDIGEICLVEGLDGFIKQILNDGYVLLGIEEVA